MATVDPTPTPDPDLNGPSGPTGASGAVTVAPWYRSAAFLIAAAAIAILVIIFVIVAAVSSGDDDDDPGHPMVTPSPTVSVSPSPSVTVSPTPDNKIDRATVLKTQFVEPFRVRFPKLATERSDTTIADLGVETCNVLLNGDLTRTGYYKALGLQLSKGPGSADEDDVREVAKLAVMNTCPDRQKAYVRLFGDI